MIFLNSVYFERWIIFHCHNVIHYEKCFDMFDFNIHKRIMLKFKCSSDSSECQSWKMSHLFSFNQMNLSPYITRVNDIIFSFSTYCKMF